MIELVGWLGSIMLAICAIPLLASCIADRSIAKNISGKFIGLWLGGEVLCLGYAAAIGDVGIPLLLNYSMNIMCLFGVLWIRWRD